MVALQCWSWKAKEKLRLGLETLTQYGEDLYGPWLMFCVNFGLPAGSSQVSADKNYLLQTMGKGSL